MRDLGAIVLAAGSSRRMQGTNKLTVELNGRPLLAHCLETISRLGLGQVIVVTGAESSAITRTVEPFGFSVVHNSGHARGMGSSISVGIDALAPRLSGAFVCLGDMPFVRAEVFRDLADVLNSKAAQCIDAVVPCHDNRHGHPVLFTSKMFDALIGLGADRGAWSIINSGDWNVHWLEVDCAGITTDIDTPNDLGNWR